MFILCRLFWSPAFRVHSAGLPRARQGWEAAPFSSTELAVADEEARAEGFSFSAQGGPGRQGLSVSDV